jgi:hypothetical protein
MKPKFAIYDADGRLWMTVQGSRQTAEANTPPSGSCIEIDPATRAEDVPLFAD